MALEFISQCPRRQPEWLRRLFGASLPHMIIARRLQSVEGAAYAVRSAIQYVGVDHRPGVAMTQKFLNRSDAEPGPADAVFQWRPCQHQCNHGTTTQTRPNAENCEDSSAPTAKEYRRLSGTKVAKSVEKFVKDDFVVEPV